MNKITVLVAACLTISMWNTAFGETKIDIINKSGSDVYCTICNTTTSLASFQAFIDAAGLADGVLKADSSKFTPDLSKWGTGPFKIVCSKPQKPDQPELECTKGITHILDMTKTPYKATIGDNDKYDPSTQAWLLNQVTQNK